MCITFLSLTTETLSNKGRRRANLIPTVKCTPAQCVSIFYNISDRKMNLFNKSTDLNTLILINMTTQISIERSVFLPKEAIVSVITVFVFTTYVWATYSISHTCIVFFMAICFREMQHNCDVSPPLFATNL